jgi:hypothetical protein
MAGRYVYKKRQFEHILEVLLLYFTFIWYILRPFVMFCPFGTLSGHFVILRAFVHFLAILYILRPFGICSVHLVHICSGNLE